MDPDKFVTGVRRAIREGKAEMERDKNDPRPKKSGDLVQTGTDADPTPMADSGFTSQGKERTPHWREEPGEKRVVRFGASRSVEPTFKDPAVVHFGETGRRLRADLYGLESRPDREESELGYMRDAGVTSGEKYEALTDKIRRVNERNRAVQKITRALDTGDREAILQELHRFPRLHKYRDEL